MNAFPLYMHVDENCCDPLPQVTEQNEDSVQDDQVGHDCVLQDRFLLCIDSPLSILNKVGRRLRDFVNIKSGL